MQKSARIENSLHKSQQKLLSIKLPKHNKLKIHSSNFSPCSYSQSRRSSIPVKIKTSQRSSPMEAGNKKSSNSPQVSSIISHKSHRKTLSECVLPANVPVSIPKLSQKKLLKKKIKKVQTEAKLKKPSKTSFSPYDTKEKANKFSLMKKLTDHFFVHKMYPETTFEYYKILNYIGRGSYSKVILCEHRLTGKKVAIKAISKDQITNRYSEEKVLREIYILKTVDSEFVVKVLEVFESEKNVLIVLEYAGGGDLLNYVRNKGKLHEKEAKLIFRQIVKGALDLHKAGILHRDFKLENILIDSRYSTVKICDFGVSKIINPGEVIYEKCGTPAYLAPEIIKNEGYKDFSADIWSLGVVLYAMICGKIPFLSDSIPEIHQLILSGKFDIPTFLSPQASSLIVQMLQLSPICRISLKRVLKHPWFTSRDSIIPDSTFPQFIPQPKPKLKENSKPGQLKICEKTAKIVSELGFDYNFLIKSLKNKEMNHATATYYLIFK